MDPVKVDPVKLRVTQLTLLQTRDRLLPVCPPSNFGPAMFRVTSTEPTAGLGGAAADGVVT